MCCGATTLSVPINIQKRGGTLRAAEPQATGVLGNFEGQLSGQTDMIQCCRLQHSPAAVLFQVQGAKRNRGIDISHVLKKKEFCFSFSVSWCIIQSLWITSKEYLSPGTEDAGLSGGRTAQSLFWETRKGIGWLHLKLITQVTRVSV